MTLDRTETPAKVAPMDPSSGGRNSSPSDSLDRLSDSAFQERMLDGVSRTFALTIPRLGEGLRLVVGNAYLICRLLDTIEDEPALPATHKEAFLEWLKELVEGDVAPEAFAEELSERLSDRTPQAERELVAQAPRVLRIARGFSPEERAALSRCARIMADGMREFQAGEASDCRGLEKVADLERYCYYVAGVVGEMLTELFCIHSGATRERRESLMALAPAFGQALQMTNILKDFWEDRERSACWLPREAFGLEGFGSETLKGAENRERLSMGLRKLVGLARGCLERSLEYTLLIPAREAGARKFCLLALGLSLLTLRKIHSRPDFSNGSEVKVSRRSVRLTALATEWLARSDHALSLLFAILARPLPRPDERAAPAPASPTPSASRASHGKGL